jgi:hypothetical protein
VPRNFIALRGFQFSLGHLDDTVNTNTMKLNEMLETFGLKVVPYSCLSMGLVTKWRDLVELKFCYVSKNFT